MKDGMETQSRMRIRLSPIKSGACNLGCADPSTDTVVSFAMMGLSFVIRRGAGGDFQSMEAFVSLP
jgi:hypothetical protein